MLLDYVDFVVHAFSERARKFYDLERLWRSAPRVNAQHFTAPARAKSRATKEKRTASAGKRRISRTKASRKKKT